MFFKEYKGDTVMGCWERAIRFFDSFCVVLVLGDYCFNSISDFLRHPIYRFKLPEVAKPMPVTYVKGIVRDKETNAFVEASIVMVDLKTDGVLFNDVTSAETGDFLTVLPVGSTYSFDVDAPGYLFYSKHY